MRPPALAAMGVVVPVHDEEEHLEGSLRSVLAACRASGLAPGCTRVVAVLDRCTDGSAAIAARVLSHGRGEVAVVSVRSAGAARAAGVRAVLRHFAGAAPAEVWLATTDADTVVPARWLSAQRRLADGGADGVAGTVEVVDWQEHPPEVPARFSAHYDGTPGVDDHDHVHGANLGVRASAYLAVGGFPPLSLAEDHALWSALVADGRPVVRTRRLAVVTSARLDPRARGGFGDFLGSLAAD